MEVDERTHECMRQVAHLAQCVTIVRAAPGTEAWRAAEAQR